jgi:hypothetical protein
MQDKKIEYPQGIYANRYLKTPDFVKSKIKIDRERAMAWLASRPERLIFLEVCDTKEVDQYGNTVYIRLDEYKHNQEQTAAQEGMQQAQRIAQQPKQQPQAEKELAEDDIPF